MNKFIINEEEKNRILGMHKSATSNHYLTEQSTGNTLPVVTKVYIEKYGNPGSGKCLQNPNLNNSCDSGKSFVEFNDGTILKYPNITYSSYVDSGTYEGDKIKSLSSPYVVSFKLNNKQYEINKY
jgi:hypothetical protein